MQYLEVNKSFKNIFQEEKAVEETKKEQQNYLVRVTKIEKQLEEARSSGEDPAKIEALESDMAGVSYDCVELIKSMGRKFEFVDIEAPPTQSDRL